MMDTLIFSYPEDEELAVKIASNLNYGLGQVTFRHFPDQESYVKIQDNLKNKNIVLVCSLNQPDHKLISLIFFSRTAKSLGAQKIGLIAPYLAYMRQDTQFQPGESFSSKYFAAIISEYFDWLLTIDPHLHRHASLDEIYSIPNKVLHADQIISKWIRKNVQNPIVIGPDVESQQWVVQVAKMAQVPYRVLRKQRHSDRSVTISAPQIEDYLNHTPVLVDDIISTGHTMIETVKHLNQAKMKPVVCIAIHAIFAGTAFQELKNSKIGKIVTCNTIAHPSNGIDITQLFSNKVLEFLIQDE